MKPWMWIAAAAGVAALVWWKFSAQPAAQASAAAAATNAIRTSGLSRFYTPPASALYVGLTR
jgi:hypothetical protein